MVTATGVWFDVPLSVLFVICPLPKRLPDLLHITIHISVSIVIVQAMDWDMGTSITQTGLIDQTKRFDTMQRSSIMPSTMLVTQRLI